MKRGELITLVLAALAIAALVGGVVMDKRWLGAIGIGLDLVVVVLIIIGHARWGWESGDAPGGMGGP